MYYIGQTRDRFSKRDWSHRHARKENRSWFDNHYTKHPEQFTHKILVTVESPSKELLVKTLNDLEISFISYYKSIGRKLFNILKGGNAGWVETEPTPKMLEALNKGRRAWNEIAKSNAMSKEEALKSHRESCERYKQNHPERYKQYYTQQNQKRAEYRKEWYQRNRDRILAKLHSKTQKSQKAAALLNSSMSLSLP